MFARSANYGLLFLCGFIIASDESQVIKHITSTVIVDLQKMIKLSSPYIDFYQSETMGIKRSVLKDVKITCINTLSQLAKIRSEPATIKNLTILEHAIFCMFFDAVLLEALFWKATTPYIMDREMLENAISLNPAIRTFLADSLVAELYETMTQIIESFNQQFMEKKLTFYSSSAVESQRNNNYLLYELFKSHVQYFNNYLITKFPLQGATSSTVQSLVVTLEDFFSKFMGLSTLYPVQIKPNLKPFFNNFNDDISILNALMETV